MIGEIGMQPRKEVNQTLDHFLGGSLSAHYLHVEESTDLDNSISRISSAQLRKGSRDDPRARPPFAGCP